MAYNSGLQPSLACLLTWKQTYLWWCRLIQTCVILIRVEHRAIHTFLYAECLASQTGTKNVFSVYSLYIFRNCRCCPCVTSLQQQLSGNHLIELAHLFEWEKLLWAAATNRRHLGGKQRWSKNWLCLHCVWVINSYVTTMEALTWEHTDWAPSMGTRGV